MSELTIEELQAQLAEKDALISEANAKNEGLKNDAAAAKRIASKYEGVDLKALQDAAKNAERFAGLDDETLTELENFKKMASDKEDQDLLKQGGFEAVLNKHMAGRIKPYEENDRRQKELLAERESRIAELENRERNGKFEREVFASVDKAGVFREGVGDYVSLEVQKRSSFEDGKFVIKGEDGQTVYSRSNPSMPMTIEEFVAEKLPSVAPALLKASKGPNAQGDGDEIQNNPFIGGTMDEQLALRDSNPTLSKKLAASARAKGHKVSKIF